MHVTFFDPSKESFCLVSHGENIFVISISGIILLVASVLISDKTIFHSGVLTILKEWPKLGSGNKKSHLYISNK